MDPVSGPSSLVPGPSTGPSSLVPGLYQQAWLILRNDLRLSWREFRSGKLRLFSTLPFLILVLLAFQALMILICVALKRPPPLAAETVIWFFFGFFMLGASMNHAVTVLFERADFDLLLSSPVSPRAILLARLTGMAASAAFAVAFFIVPMLNGAAIGISAHYLFGYVVWLQIATITSCGGVWLTLLLVRWLGARRARIWVQVIAAVLGATIYILFQVQNAMPLELRQKMATTMTALAADPTLTLVPRAARGEWLPLLTLLGVAGIAALITTRVLGRTFVTGIQEAGVVRVRKRTGGSYRFASGLIWATFLKDLRLIVRDPLLLSRVLPSVFYLVPVLFPLHRLGQVGAAGVLGPFAVFAALMLSGTLTLVAASGEEGWDLIRLSPASTVTLRIAKIAAGMAVPTALVLIVALVITALGRPGLALLSTLTALTGAAASCWLEVAAMKPTPRKDLIQRGGRVRGRTTIGRVATSFVFIVGGTGAAVLAAKELWWWAWLGFGIVLLVALACFTLVEMEDIEFESTTTAPVVKP